MLQDLSDSSIEFQVFGPWNFKLNILLFVQADGSTNEDLEANLVL